MLLGVSTGACYPFVGSKYQQVKLVSSLRPEVQGIEIIFPRPNDLVKFNLGGRTAKILRSFEFVSLHYPFTSFLSGSKISEKALVKKIAGIDNAIGLRHVVVHPHSVKKWRHFKNLGPKVLLENQDSGIGKRYQAPKAMKGILRETGFGMCLDLNHSMDCGINPNDFLSLKAKIRQVHINTINASGTRPHQFLVDSSPSELKQAKRVLKRLKGKTWILEPKSKANPRKKLLREIAFVKRV